MNKQNFTGLIMFGASHCGPCRQMKPIFEKMDGPIFFVDVDKNPELATEYGIRSLPTFLSLSDGKVVDSHIGSCTEAKLIQMISKVET